MRSDWWRSDGSAYVSACGWFTVSPVAWSDILWLAVDAYHGRCRRGTLGECRRWCERRARLVPAERGK